MIYALCFVLYMVIGVFVIATLEAVTKANNPLYKPQEDVGVYVFGVFIWPLALILSIAEIYFNWLVAKLKKDDK